MRNMMVTMIKMEKLKSKKVMEGRKMAEIAQENEDDGDVTKRLTSELEERGGEPPGDVMLQVTGEQHAPHEGSWKGP